MKPHAGPLRRWLRRVDVRELGSTLIVACVPLGVLALIVMGSIGVGPFPLGNGSPTPWDDTEPPAEASVHPELEAPTSGAVAHVGLNSPVKLDQKPNDGEDDEEDDGEDDDRRDRKARKSSRNHSDD